MNSVVFFSVITVLFSASAAFIIFSTVCLIRGGVLYLGSPRAVVKAMLAMADIQPGESVYDLGCGDGRLIVPAVRQFKALATGIDISGTLLTLAWLRSRLWRSPVRLIRQNLLNADISDADVVFIYLMPEIIEKLHDRFRKLKPGSRIICHQFGLNGWRTDFEMEVNCWIENTRLLRYRVDAAGIAASDTPTPVPVQTADRSRWPESKITSVY